MSDIAVEHTKVEEDESGNDGDDGANGDNFHGKVAVGAAFHFLFTTFVLHFAGSESDSTLDDAPRADNADDTRHGDTTNADALAVGSENHFGTHVANGSGDGWIPLIQNGVREDKCHARNENPPYEK